MLRAGILAFAALLSFVFPAVAQTPLPVEAFGRLPQAADAAISPDGSKIALARNDENGASVVIINVDTQQREFAARVPDGVQLRGVGWASDRYATFLISRAFAPGAVLPDSVRYRGAPHRVSLWRNGVVDLTTRQMRLLSTSDEAWRDDGASLIAPIEGEPAFGRLVGRGLAIDATHASVFRVSFDTGDARQMLVRGENANTIGYVLDERGHAAVRMDSDERTNHWGVFVYDDDAPRPFADGVSDFGDPLDVRGLLPDGRLVAIDYDAANAFYTAYALDRGNGQRTELVHRDSTEIAGTISDPWTRRIVGLSWTESEFVQHFFDADLSAVYTRIEQPFGGAARIVSWSRDRAHILFYAERGLDGGAYYLFTPATGQTDRVSYLYPEIAAQPRGERQAITYRARDGTRIPAYLTLPSADIRNAPLVVLVHGGPSARDSMDFDWWAAFLASRGYVVLQPNFRGSGGFGAAWERAGHGEWGGLMQTDVEDGIAPLARAGIIDASRVCIVGASYGGYAALAGASLTPDRYRCAVSVAGLSDLNAFLRQREEATGVLSATSDYWHTSIGNRHDDGAHLRAVSPANLVDRVQIPILIIHGTDDTIVPISQSRLMRDRLQAAGKTVRYVELTGDDHYLSDAPTRTLMLRELDTFLAQNLAPH